MENVQRIETDMEFYHQQPRSYAQSYGLVLDELFSLTGEFQKVV